MTEKPIIFSGPMVRSILDGGKTQTRRVINLKIGGGKLSAKAIGFTQSDQMPLCWYGHIAGGGPTDGFIDEFLCPYGQPGDRLWVREAFCRDLDRTLCYRADEVPYHAELTRWKSPRYMPRKFCRLFLDVKAVRVERLQDISEADAKAEGVIPDEWPRRHWSDYFVPAWESLNEKRGYGWSVNPWVWVVEFEKVAA